MLDAFGAVMPTYEEEDTCMSYEEEDMLDAFDAVMPTGSRKVLFDECFYEYF